MFLLLSQAIQAGPLSERVIIVAKSQGLDKLYICRPDGKDIRRLSKSRGSQQAPHYSYVLNRFFFVRLNGRRGEICSVDSEGEDFTVHVDTSADAWDPNVHPNGERFVFSTDRWGSRELAEYHLKSGEIVRLTYDQGTSTHPRYSPDGESLVFLSRRHGQSELYLMELEDRTTHRLTDSTFHEGPAEWSPDGKSLITTRIRPPRERSQLLEIRLADRREKYLLSQSKTLVSPSYSADGNQILFVEADMIKTYDKSDTQASTFPLRGTFQVKGVKWVTVPLP